jgi:hypothetical protein
MPLKHKITSYAEGKGSILDQKREQTIQEWSRTNDQVLILTYAILCFTSCRMSNKMTRKSVWRCEGNQARGLQLYVCMITQRDWRRNESTAADCCIITVREELSSSCPTQSPFLSLILSVIS